MYFTNDKIRAVNEIKKFIYILSENSYPSIPRTTIDGNYDEETKAAVKEFQRIEGLKESGNVDYETFTALYEAYRTSVIDMESADYALGGEGFPYEEGMLAEDIMIINMLINKLSTRYGSVERVNSGRYFSADTGNAVEALRKIYLMNESRLVDRAFFDRLILDVKAAKRMEEK